jgi:hypothetical protein
MFGKLGQVCDELMMINDKVLCSGHWTAPAAVVQLHLSPNPILLKRVHLVQLVILEEPQSEDPSGRPRDNMSIFINI